MAQKLAEWLLVLCDCPHLLAAVQKILCEESFEAELCFPETGSTHPLVMRELLFSAPCLLRPCCMQSVCMGSAPRVRNLQGNLRAGVVDECPTRRSAPPPSPAAREFEACAQFPSSSVSVGVRFHLHCYFAVRRKV